MSNPGDRSGKETTCACARQLSRTEAEGWRMEAEEVVAQRRDGNGMRREEIGKPVARERRVGSGARSWEARGPPNRRGG